MNMNFQKSRLNPPNKQQLYVRALL